MKAVITRLFSYLFLIGKDCNMSIPQGTPSPVPLGPGHCCLSGIPHHAGRLGPVGVSVATSAPWCVWSPAKQTWAWSPTVSPFYHMACSDQEASLATWASAPSLFEIMRGPHSFFLPLCSSGVGSEEHCDIDGQIKEGNEASATLMKRRVFTKERAEGD